ncbi:MAG: DUF1697 domain-containing protein [Desulfobulbaceae bacterium]|nr:DUF1697 domain-containing protein [Desulfobulbaceae bacterium]
MNVWGALLRGINVGGKNSLPMPALIFLLEELGARDIKTYIQSGNAVFRRAEQNIPQLGERLSAAIKIRHGFAPQVLILGLAAIEKAMAENPFPETVADPGNLHLGYLACPPEHPDLAKLERLRRESERFQLAERVFYLYAPEGVARSKLAANSERALGVVMTDRNWQTVSKIMDLARAARCA